MFENEGSTSVVQNPMLALVIFLVGVCLGFVVVGPLVGFVISLPFYEGNMLSFIDAMQDPSQHPEIKLPIYILQGSATLIGLIVTPWLLLRLTGVPAKSLFRNTPAHLFPYVVTPLIVIVFMGVNSVVVQWNADIHFPEFMRGFEAWAREKEDAAAELTAFMTRFGSIPELLVALLVIAVIPAIGEEFVFRGIIQRQLKEISGNAHVAIWLAAVIFSAFHLQFYGFLPRVLLGALFGYLYWWSGSLVIAMVAHFVNNAFALLSLYFYQRGAMDFNPEDTHSFSPYAVAFSAALTAVLLYYFRDHYRRQGAMV